MGMTWDYEVSQGATAAKITATLTGADGTPVPFQSGDAVTLLIEPPGGALIVNAVATITKPGAASGDPLQGQVTYQFQAADLATPGGYYMQFEVVYANGTKDWFPTEKMTVLIVGVLS